MARRGEELRRHILFAAKDVFLEMGFERASMDLVASRAETSKRTLYAHFESKDKLFIAVVDLARQLYLGRLGTPGAYSDDDAEAVVLFCGRFLQLLLWEPSLRTCRLSIAETERLPEASAGYHTAIFETSLDRLAAFLTERWRLDPSTGSAIAHELLGRTVYPRLFRALLGLEEPLRERREQADIAADIDLGPLRALLAARLPG
jgi:AcrR family transcriptional regulator